MLWACDITETYFLDNSVHIYDIGLQGDEIRNLKLKVLFSS